MTTDFLTLDDVSDWNGKTVLVRVDINSAVDPATKVVSEGERVRVHAVTVRELAQKGAKVVVLAHQGRAGDDDFTHLDQHAAHLSKACKKKVKYVQDVTGPAAIKEIQKLKPGKILLLDNVRMLAEEGLEKTADEHSKSLLVGALAPLANAFVNDAYSAAHRSQCTLMGFTPVLPSYAGRVMERELVNNAKAAEHARHPNIYILGGAKPDDVAKLLKKAVETPNVDKVLTAGVLGELCIVAKGGQLSAKKRAWMTSKGFDKVLATLTTLLSDPAKASKVEVPVDLAVENNGQRVEIAVEHADDRPSYDVGSKTTANYVKIIKTAKTVYVKGPTGMYENPIFALSTKEIFTAVAKSGAFSLVGGGNTLDAFEKFGINQKKLGQVSIAGGALIAYLSGEPLPAVEALKAAAKRQSN